MGLGAGIAYGQAEPEPATWQDGDVPSLALSHASSQPWDDTREGEQRAWLGLAANQLVNSLRPRLLSRMGGSAA